MRERKREKINVKEKLDRETVLRFDRVLKISMCEFYRLNKKKKKKKILLPINEQDYKLLTITSNL